MAVPDARVELQIAGTWTDVTDDALHAGAIRYSWGRRGEGSRTDPAAASFALLNLDGKYSSRNPRGPYYGQLGRNTPARLSHGGAGTALLIPGGVQTRATTPDTAALDITGDIDVRADLTPVAWAGASYPYGWEVMGKYGAPGQMSWMLRITDGGILALHWTTDGTTELAYGSDIPIPFGPGQRGAVRIALDVNNGSGGFTVTYYTAPTMAGPWTQLGTPDVTTSGTTSIFSSTAGLEVGDVASQTVYSDIARNYHAIEVRNGIAGTAVANPDFTAQANGATSFADAAGRTWSVAAGLISSRRTRAVLEAASWTPKWTSASDVSTPVTAAGILRRLGQGQKALSSTLRRTVSTVLDGPKAYWPMEDGSAATQAASAVAGAGPLVVSDFSFGADSSCPGADSLPTIGAAATMEAEVPAHTSPTESYSVAMMYSLDALPASSSRILGFETSGTGRVVEVLYTATDLVCNVFSSSSTLLGTFNFACPGFGPGKWWRVFVTAERNGANTDFVFGVAGDGGSFSGGFSVAGTPGTVVKIGTGFGPLLSGMAVGHLAVYADSAAIIFWGDAQAGFAGEEAPARVQRLCEEEGLPITIADGGGARTLMGPQRPAQLLDLLGEVEAADGGILCEDPERLGFFYRTRSSLYSQGPKLTLSYSQLAPPLEPVDDDRWVRNDRTVQRAGGSSARAVLTSGALSVAAPPDGVGPYDDSQTVNVHSDSQLPDLAAWLLHLGTWDESRYPRVRIYLHKYPSLIPAAATLRPGDVIRITDLPAWLPPGPIDLMVQGAEEVFKTFEWTITLACSPAGPWTVGVLDDVVLGRADTAGSTLASGITSTATAFSVATSTGPLWTVDPAEFPFNIAIGGEVMTVTAISGSSSPQTVTATRSVNGIVKAHSAGATVQLATPMILSL